VIWPQLLGRVSGSVKEEIDLQIFKTGLDMS